MQKLKNDIAYIYLNILYNEKWNVCILISIQLTNFGFGGLIVMILLVHYYFRQKV